MSLGRYNLAENLTFCHIIKVVKVIYSTLNYTQKKIRTQCLFSIRWGREKLGQALDELLIVYYSIYTVNYVHALPVSWQGLLWRNDSLLLITQHYNWVYSPKKSYFIPILGYLEILIKKDTSKKTCYSQKGQSALSLEGILGFFLISGELSAFHHEKVWRL